MTAPTLDLITTAHREPNLDWLLRAETPADAYRQRRTSRFVTEFFPGGRQIEDAAIWTLLSADGPPGLVDWGDCPTPSRPIHCPGCGSRSCVPAINEGIPS